MSATDSVTVDADLAVVRVGYKLFGPDAKSAYASALEASNNIMQALLAAGVPKTSIESTSQVLQHTLPNDFYPYQANSLEFAQRQFTAMQNWTVRVKPDDAARALNAAIDAGANESGWIEWVVSSPATPQAEALARAVADARQMAEQIAQKSNVHLGHLVSVQQSQNSYAFGGPVAGIDGIGMGHGVGVDDRPLAINSRRVQFTMTVFAVFAIE